MSDDRVKRRHPRARVPLLVQYRFSPLEDYQTDYSADLSRGGMFIYAEAPRPVGSLLYIQFITRDGARIIRGQGRIVRTAEAEGPEGRRGQAVEFIDFDEDDVSFLDALVKRCLEEQEAKGQRPERRPPGKRGAES